MSRFAAVPDAEAVLDTNVLVAALRSRQGASWHILDLVHREEVRVHVTVPLALEYEEVLLRHRKAAGWSRRETLAFLGLFLRRARCHETRYLWREHADDPEYAHVLEAIIAAQASCLVTFNTGDFTGADQFRVEVMRPGALLRKIE
ncbi:putative toxin-antitoxin system toxin component, PIN family [Salinibacter altiplanensis]|uniref:putative toxin-antitoxin system toxin component, PIN family n=1 Tax=Salinibacter altiplanensis TaxID=1803181 RepID=UPI000C9ED431|nr:putative toxin-antitoxin system toxin component, PIN family [Salinibacter altiplanensis]